MAAPVAVQGQAGDFRGENYRFHFRFLGHGGGSLRRRGTALKNAGKTTRPGTAVCSCCRLTLIADQASLRN
jgi:hypothetical protein